jgi:PDZ domain-containing protein
MQRRGVTVLFGAVLVLALMIGVLSAPVPYLVMQPGPTYDTLGENPDGDQVIQIIGAEATTSAGELHLTTVKVGWPRHLWDAIDAWWDDDLAVVPEELIYPPGQPPEQVHERNEQDFARSESAAELAALRYLEYPSQVVVVEVLDGAPAAGRLAAEDVITSINGTPAATAAEVRELVSAQPAGSTVTVGYQRAGQPGTVEVTTAAADDGSPQLGIRIVEEFDTPFELQIALEDIGGPSAGLMLALGIIDALDPVDLTGGHIIAGTGTIDEFGNVGPIGGVPQKLAAARDLGAALFFVPSANCAEAVKNAPPGIPLARVDTLADATDALAALRAGREPPTC